jgi:superfamily II DNA or RNA helicase
MTDRSRSPLEAAIADEEARLKTIEQERKEILGRLAQLRRELVAAHDQPGGDDATPTGAELPSLTTTEKVALFRTLFCGRDDIYPKLWENARTGKKGYAPACTNEWVRGVCEKPRVKCGECPNQAFLRMTDQAVLDHLQGRHVIGVYPMLTDESCRFLAVDFDKRAWMNDVAAFVETCRSSGVPVAIERSRSGNGAHAWFFFAAQVPAALARRMGCFLLTETMTRRHELSMESYDRLFPNQDTMPRGGFGNLIALPLQRRAREQGNTVFVDDRFAPMTDQWAYLAACERISPERVEDIAAAAMRKGRVIGVRGVDLDDEERRAPWTRPPSGKQKHVACVVEPLPPAVHVVLAQRIFVAKAGLPSTLLNEIKRLAAFQNPEFYKKQCLRLSTALIPRVIACAEDLSEFVSLPRGCMGDFDALLREHGIGLDVDDQRTAGDGITWLFNGELTTVQLAAARSLLRHDEGVFVAPPGAGKTVVGAYLTAQRARNTLVLVHRQPLLDQWVAQLSLFLGLERKAIGCIGAGKRKANGQIDVAMLQSLVRGDAVDDLVAGYGHVIVDECHHVPAVSFERVLSAVRAKYVTGLTATPKRRDGHHPIIDMQLGPVRFAIEPRSQAANRPFAHRLIVRETGFRQDGDASSSTPIQDLYRAMSVDEQRNRLIIDDVLNALEERRSPIVLTERKDHLDYLAAQLRSVAKNLIVLRGGMGAKQRREVAARIAAIPSDAERLVLATGRYIGEGFDDSRLDTLFLALPVSWKGTLVQYAGRLHRSHAGKREVRIFDYVDRFVPMLARMFEKRLRGYRAIGYEQAGLPERYKQPPNEPIVEWDEPASVPVE